MIGATFGNVVAVRLLGVGSMGAVYEGFQKSLRRRVALKLLRKTGGSRDPVRRQFLEEAETVARLSHQNIVPIFDAGEASQYYFQVMQLVNGADLGTLLRSLGRHPVSDRRLIARNKAVEIVIRVLEALGYAHAAGVVHRDIKPANIMIERAGNRPLIVDFGIARTARLEHWTDGKVVGSVRYLSPEQAAGDETDRRTDIYSVGTVLLELLAGTLPLRPNEDDRRLLARKIRQPGSLFVAAPSEFSSRIDAALEAIILRATAPRRADRYPNCDAFRNELLQWRHDRQREHDA